MPKRLEDIIDWEAVRANSPMQEVLNIVEWLKAQGFEAWHRVTERDSFGPLCVLITAYKDNEKYEYLY